jgi:PAS domain S-box-containing protein
MTESAAPASRFRALLSGFRGQSESSRLPVKVCAAYLLLGVTWVLVEDLVLEGHSGAKDMVFVLASAWLVYRLVDYGMKKIRRSESALRESEERMSLLLETTPSGVILFDRGGSLTYANAAAADLLGSLRGEMAGRSCREIVRQFSTPDGTPLPRTLGPTIRILRSGGSLHDVECAVRHPDGRRVVLSVNSAPMRGALGRPDGMILTLADVTERSDAQDLNLRKLSQAIEHSPVGIMITDAESRIEYVNPTCTRMTGYSPGELAGTRKTTLCDDSPGKCALVCRAVREGGGWKEEIERRRKSGESYWESVRVSPIRGPDGAVTHYVWIREDVTEHRRADEALRESEEQFRRIFEQNEEAVLIFRAGTCEILDANPAAVALYGYSREELAERGPALFVEPADRERFEGLIANIGEDDVVQVDRTTHVRKWGGRIIVSIRGKSIRLREGRVGYVTFRDITARLRMEEEMKQHHAQLIHANRMASLGTIVSGVAHEINNPNNLIMFNAPMIVAAWESAAPILEERYRERGDFDLGGLPYSEMRDAVPKLHRGIAEASARIKNIVGGLKDYVRRDTQNLETRVDVNAVVSNALSILHHAILRGTHSFHVDYGPGPPMVMGSSQQLEQVVINLITNSLQALPDPWCAIAVSTRVNEATGHVEIRVRDEGAGMPDEVLARIAEPFFSTRLDAGGLGLGLSISHAIVRSHKGTLRFDSEPGAGTTAVISLPPAPAGAPAADADPAVSAAREGGKDWIR